MKEYCTLVTSDISSSYDGYPKYSGHRDEDPGEIGDSVLTRLMRNGWEVIDATCVPKLSTEHHDPKFVFVLEREQRTAEQQFSAQSEKP